MPSFSSSLEDAIRKAIALANEHRHELATLEHLLFALTDERDAAIVMRACAVDLGELKDALETYIEEELATLVTSAPDSEAVPTANFQRVIQRAAIHVQSSGRSEVTGANVLIAIFAERESHAAHFLQEQDMTRYDAVNFVSHGVAKNPDLSAEPRLSADENDADENDGDESDGDTERGRRRAARRAVGARILDNVESVRFFSEFMAQSVREEIERVGSGRPNSLEAEKAQKEKIEALELFLLAFTRISEALEHLAETPEPRRREHLGGAVSDAWSPIGGYLSEHAPGWVSSGINLGLIGVGVSFFGLLGLPASASLAAATTTVTAPMLLKFAGKVNVSLTKDR